MSRPLEGITVLDLTHMLSGPYGTMTLTDLGARTIKVEPPGQGEGTRELLDHHPDYSRGGMDAAFLARWACWPRCRGANAAAMASMWTCQYSTCISRC